MQPSASQRRSSTSTKIIFGREAASTAIPRGTAKEAKSKDRNRIEKYLRRPLRQTFFIFLFSVSFSRQPLPRPNAAFQAANPTLSMSLPTFSPCPASELRDRFLLRYRRPDQKVAGSVHPFLRASNCHCGQPIALHSAKREIRA